MVAPTKLGSNQRGCQGHRERGLHCSGELCPGSDAWGHTAIC